MSWNCISIKLHCCAWMENGGIHGSFHIVEFLSLVSISRNSLNLLPKGLSVMVLEFVLISLLLQVAMAYMIVGSLKELDIAARLWSNCLNLFWNSVIWASPLILCSQLDCWGCLCGFKLWLELWISTFLLWSLYHCF